jgi:hypothetical protein
MDTRGFCHYVEDLDGEFAFFKHLELPVHVGRHKNASVSSAEAIIEIWWRRERPHLSLKHEIRS